MWSLGKPMCNLLCGTYFTNSIWSQDHETLGTQLNAICHFLGLSWHLDPMNFPLLNSYVACIRNFWQLADWLKRVGLYLQVTGWHHWFARKQFHLSSKEETLGLLLVKENLIKQKSKQQILLFTSSDCMGNWSHSCQYFLSHGSHAGWSSWTRKEVIQELIFEEEITKYSWRSQYGHQV